MSVQVLGQMAPRNRAEVASEVLRGLFEMVSVDASGRPMALAAQD